MLVPSHGETDVPLMMRRKEVVQAWAGGAGEMDLLLMATEELESIINSMPSTSYDLLKTSPLVSKGGGTRGRSMP